MSPTADQVRIAQRISDILTKKKTDGDWAYTNKEVM